MSHFADSPGAARICSGIVKLFDGFGQLGPFDEAGDTVEAAVADNGHDLERIAKIDERVTVDKNEVCNRACADSSKRWVDTECSGRIHARRA